jgi:hypothetical protein
MGISIISYGKNSLYLRPARKRIEFVRQRSTEVPLKGWKSSNVWEQLVTNQNSTVEEIKSRLELGNACYHSVQSLLFSVGVKLGR